MPYFRYGGQIYEWGQDEAPQGAEPLPSYTSQQGEQYQWSPELVGREGWQAPSATIYHGSNLLELLDKQGSGQPLSLADQSKWEEVRRGTEGLPTRDWRTLLYPNEGTDQPGQRARYPAITDPDYLPMLQQVYAAAAQGDEQARTLLPELRKFQEFATYNSTIKQDNFSPLGDNLFGALMMLGMGASMGSAAPLFAAGTTAGTLGGIGSVAGAASGLTGMLGEGLDLDALRKASIAMGAAGGFAGAGSLLSGGLNSIGDYVKLAQKLYGAGSKTLGLAQGGGSTPDAPRPTGSTSQALSAADQRTAGRSSTGGSSMAEGNILDSLGPLLGAAIGAVGMGISLEDTKRFTDQLKTRYGQQEETKRLIDQAYQLAVARYEMTYAQSQEERFQKQTAYEDAWNKYQTHYGQTQLQQEQQQIQYLKNSGQIDEDRARQLTIYNENRKLDMDNFYERRQQSLEDRATERSAWEKQYWKNLEREDERAGQARDERGLDLNAYQQRQAVGRNLSDPGTIAAGAQALYNPLSAAARDRINTQTEEEMARRGVAEGGQFANLMAAKAFAPQEAQLWQNAMQNYLTGQQGAVNAYSQQDMTMVPQFSAMNTPRFTNIPDYSLGAPPEFLRASGATVPTPPGVATRPVPPTTSWDALRLQPEVPGQRGSYYPQPYSPYGAVDGSGGAGGGIGGALKNAGPLAEQLGKLLGGNAGLVSQVMKLLGGGGGGTDAFKAFTAWGGDETQQPWYDPMYMDWGTGQTLYGDTDWAGQYQGGLDVFDNPGYDAMRTDLWSAMEGSSLW